MSGALLMKLGDAIERIVKGRPYVLVLLPETEGDHVLTVAGELTAEQQEVALRALTEKGLRVLVEDVLADTVTP